MKAGTSDIRTEYAEVGPAATPTPRSAKSGTAEHIYEEIPDLTPSSTPKVKAGTSDIRTEYAEVGPAATPTPRSAKSGTAEPIYEEIPDLTPSSAPKVKVVKVEEAPPALPPRPRSAEENANNNNNNNNNDNDSQSQRSLSQGASASNEAAATPTEKVSFLQKVKNFFTGTKAKVEKKAESSEVKSSEVSNKPNYDDLEDSLNLKDLLALETKRNESFEQKVLKNEDFLNEARESAKKSVPESVIKQMGNSPELDEILTDGAKRVERRINEALTFQPKAEEFAEIQQLVKQLPKGDAIESVEEKTRRITEALAETSKTIQRNPKLKEEIGEAIGEFLRRSQNEDLTVEMIEKLNHGLRPDEGEGRELYKKETLTKENAVFSSPASSKIQLAETVAFINQAKANGVEPSVLAGLVYQRLIAYHPFAEGNGRMARVLVNKLLLDAGYPAFTKFREDFETQIIPQTEAGAKSATSSEVITEFLKELKQKPLPKVTDASLAGSVSKPVVPEVDTVQEKARVITTEDSDYAEIDAPVSPKTPKVTPSESTAPAKAESVEAASEKPAVEAIYAKVNKSPEAVAEANAKGDEAAKKLGDPRVKKAEVEDVPPVLPPRNIVKVEPEVAKATPVSDRVNNRELAEKPRAFLDKVKDKFQPLKVKGKIKDVRESAKAYDGEVSFPFAQSKGEVYKEIIKHAETQNGVCESTCAHWIAKKVQDDQSLWDDLYNGGSKAGKLNQEAIDSIKKLQSEFINAGSATQQFKLTEEWLSEKGVTAKQKKVGDFSRKDEVSGTVSSKNIDALVKAILDTGSQETGIKKISINLKGGSHTVSAAVEGGKVVFFDPNFGEITFSSHDKFAEWMKKAFWQKSGYAGTDNEKRFFNVVNYNL
ncbi:YopT-type cysteine protease domain-containing protein [Actinobacillus equuli subsp. equuli]